MYKIDVIKRVARDTRLSQKVVGDALDSALKVLQQALKEGRTVTFLGFGTFYTSERKEGTARHFKTGQQIKYPARRVAAFRVGDVLKKAVRKTKVA
jgi:DNA-binding protein HU-beta